MSSAQGRFWRFYWPLSLIGVVILAGHFGQNYVLLGYDEGVRELAVFALALAVYSPFRAALGFIPQAANVLVRGPHSARALLRFLVGLCIISTLPLVALGWTPLGPALLPFIYNVGPERISLICAYLRWFTPLIVIGGASSFFIGLLIQAHRTGSVTLLKAFNLALMIGVLATGIALAWSPVVTLSLSLLLPQSAQLLLGGLLVASFHEHHAPQEDSRLAVSEISAYYLPMVATSVMFTLSRPIIFAFLTGLGSDHGPDPEPLDAMVAGISLAFTLGMVFQSAINQFRHLLVTFDRRDLAGVRVFMRRVALAVTLLMLLAVATPFAEWFLREMQGATGRTLVMARQALWVLCLVPAVVAWRNYYHGLAMIHRRTSAMFFGSVNRNLGILVGAGLLVAAGCYNHVTAAAMLVVGFASEATTVWWLTGRRQSESNTRQAR